MLKQLRQFRKREDGMAAVEFALIVPILIVLFFGTVEVCNALSCHQKVTTVASSAADLVAQATQVSKSDMDNIFYAANAILVPFSAANNSIVVSSVGGDGKVIWSDATAGATSRTVGSSVTIPDGLVPDDCATSGDPHDNCSLILAEVLYKYNSPYGEIITGTMNMADTFWSKPRRAIKVICTDC